MFSTDFSSFSTSIPTTVLPSSAATSPLTGPPTVACLPSPKLHWSSISLTIGINTNGCSINFFVNWRKIINSRFFSSKAEPLNTSWAKADVQIKKQLRLQLSTFSDERRSITGCIRNLHRPKMAIINKHKKRTKKD